MASIEKLLELARGQMRDGEKALAIVKGGYERKLLGSKGLKTGAFVATDTRILFYGKRLFGFDLESFPYENISSFEQSRGALGDKITFYASGNSIEMKYIKGDITRFMEKVHSRLEMKKSPVSNISVADELTKLAALKENGHITPEEFEAKKKQLLK